MSALISFYQKPIAALYLIRNINRVCSAVLVGSDEYLRDKAIRIGLNLKYFRTVKEVPRQKSWKFSINIKTTCCFFFFFFLSTHWGAAQCIHSNPSFANEQVHWRWGKGKSYSFLYTALKLASWCSTCGQSGRRPNYSNKDAQFNNVYFLVSVIPNKLLLLLA